MQSPGELRRKICLVAIVLTAHSVGLSIPASLANGEAAKADGRKHLASVPGFQAKSTDSYGFPCAILKHFGQGQGPVTSKSASTNFPHGYAQVKLSADLVLYPLVEAGRKRSSLWFSLKESDSGAQRSVDRTRAYWSPVDKASIATLFGNGSVHAIKLPAGSSVFVGNAPSADQIGKVGKRLVCVPAPSELPGLLVNLVAALDTSHGVAPAKGTLEVKAPEENAQKSGSNGGQLFAPTAANPATYADKISDAAGQLFAARKARKDHAEAPTTALNESDWHSVEQIPASPSRVVSSQSQPRFNVGQSNIQPSHEDRVFTPDVDIAESAPKLSSKPPAPLRVRLEPQNLKTAVRTAPSTQSSVQTGVNLHSGTSPHLDASPRQFSQERLASGAGDSGKHSEELEWTFPDKRVVTGKAAQPEAATWIDARTGKAEPKAVPSPSNSATWIDARTGEVTPPADAAGNSTAKNSNSKNEATANSRPANRQSNSAQPEPNNRPKVEPNPTSAESTSSLTNTCPPSAASNHDPMEAYRDPEKFIKERERESSERAECVIPSAQPKRHSGDAGNGTPSVSDSAGVQWDESKKTYVTNDGREWDSSKQRWIGTGDQPKGDSASPAKGAVAAESVEGSYWDESKKTFVTKNGYQWDESKQKWIGFDDKLGWSYDPNNPDELRRWEKKNPYEEQKETGASSSKPTPAPTDPNSVLKNPFAIDPSDRSMESSDDYSKLDAELLRTSRNSDAAMSRLNGHLESSGINAELQNTRNANLHNSAAMNELAKTANAQCAATLATGVATCVAIGAQELARQAQARNGGGGGGGGDGQTIGSGNKYATGDLYYADANKSVANNNQPARRNVTIRYNTQAELQRHMNNFRSEGLIMNVSSTNDR